MTTIDLHTEKLLLEKIAEGDEPSFRCLFDYYYRKLYFFLFRLVKSDQVAEELTMDVFMKIWVGRSVLPEIDNFNGFLFRVAKNKAIDFFRSVEGNSKLKELLWEEIRIAGSSNADSRLMLQEFEDHLRIAVGLLSPQKKLVFSMSRHEGLTHEQIAEKLNISRSTVNNHLVEAQKFIRNYLTRNMDVAFTYLICSEFL